MGFVPEATKAYLFYTNPVDRSRQVDSVVITQGQFAFKGTLPIPGPVTIYTAHGFNGNSIDRDKRAWRNAIHKEGLPWVQVSDLKFWNNDVVKRYSIRLIPQNLLIGPDGVILARNLYGDDLGKKLAEVLRRHLDY